MYGWAGIEQGGGLKLMIVGMIVVFAALLLLMVIMILLKRYQEWIHLRVQRKQRSLEALENLRVESQEEIPGTVIAAIALTLIFEDDQVHDDEALVLTLRSLRTPYPNWWQNRIDHNWTSAITPSRAKALTIVDPIRGKQV
ncbi:OadG family protein [bacterium]|nr:OadG family protein [bacterium]